MKYFCSFSYVRGNTPCFGNCTLETTIDPYDDIVEFHDKLKEFVKESQVILLFYKSVKS
jgi:hypothetical protein